MMTTIVSNSSGGGGGGRGTTRPPRENRKPHHQTNKSGSTNNNAIASNLSNVAGGSANSNNETAGNHQQQGDEFRNKTDKFQPTAEQMRIASLMSDKKDDDLKPKIEKIVELTGASREDAAVALHDCDNDMTKAIEMILDGESFDSEWQSTGRKKKTKGQTNQIGDGGITNGGAGGSRSTEKSARSNKNNASLGGGGGPQSKRSGKPPGQANRKRDSRVNNENNRIDTEESSDGVFGAGAVGNVDQQNRKGNLIGGKRGAPRGRAPRGKGVARGSRTFMNRGIQNTNSGTGGNAGTRGDNANDGFPNSIETWTNNAAEPSKPVNDDLNTMTVGNWSDVAAQEDLYNEEDWTRPLETKIYTPSTKVIPEKDELKEQSSKSHSDSAPVYLSSKNEESSQPSMSSIISNNIQRPTAVAGASAGQAFIQQIQQQSGGVPQNSSMNPYDLNHQFDSKRATESIKSLVGINSMAGDHSLENLSKAPQQTSNQSRIKQVQGPPGATAAAPSKIPESAVEMPSANDRGVANLTLHFGSLDFGTSNFPLGSNDPSMFDQVNPNASKKPENKANLTMLSTNASENQYRSSNSNTGAGGGNTNKNLLQAPGLPHALNESMLNNQDHRSDKTLNANSYHTSKPIDRKNDYNIGQLSHHKSVYAPQNTGDTGVYTNYQQALASAANVGYYSSSNQIPFGATTNQHAMNQTAALMANNPYNNSAYNNNAQKIRDMDNANNQVQQQPNQVVNVSSSPSGAKSYETSGSQPTAGMVSMMSSSTSTTNAIKNTVPSTKGIHNVPLGVNNSVQAAQVINPYIMSNPGMGIHPYHYGPYDMQFSTTPRDHGYSPYAAADVKYSRQTDSDLALPVSSHQQVNAVQTGSQAHNFYPPGYPYAAFAYANFAQSMYGAGTQPPMYPVPQVQNAATGNSAFGKPNTAANYGSHAYNNSAYESLGTGAGGAGVPQTQDYASKSYQQHKQMAGTNAVGGDMSAGNPANMYSKAHPQMNKTYDKQGFQAQAPQMNMTNPAAAAAQSAAATLSSAYSNAYMLPHQQPMHPFATGVDHSGVAGGQQATTGGGGGGGVPNQRALSQTHKSGQSNPVGGGHNYGNHKFWN